MTIHLEPQELKLAEKIAHRIGSRWSMVETDDLTSHLYLWLLQNIKHVERYRNDHGTGRLYVALRNEALRYCTKETAARVGQPINKDNFYKADMLERTLPFIFEQIPQTTVKVDPRTGQAQSVGHEYDTALAIMADIKGGFYGLHASVREVLELRFRDGLTFEEIAEVREITKDGAKKLVDRAIGRLVDALAGDRP